MFFSLDISMLFSQYFVNNKENQSVVMQRFFPALWHKHVHRHTVIPLLSRIILDRWKSLLPSNLSNAIIDTLLKNCCYRYLFHLTENNTRYQICDSWLKICMQKWKIKCDWRHALKRNKYCIIFSSETKTYNKGIGLYGAKLESYRDVVIRKVPFLLIPVEFSWKWGLFPLKHFGLPFCSPENVGKECLQNVRLTL